MLSINQGSVLITELNANPGLPSKAALAIEPSLTADDLDFVEIYNGTTETVDLTDWRIRGGADYDFDAGQLIGAGEILVVLVFEPNDLDNATRVEALRASSRTKECF